MTSNHVLKKMTYLAEHEIPPFINSLLCENKALTIGFLNQYGYNLIAESPEVKSLFLDLDFLLRDGVGIKMACKYYGISPGENLNGTDLIPVIIKQLSLQEREIKFFAYGTKQPWLKNGAEALFQHKDFEQLEGFLPEQSYIEHFSAHGSATALNIIILAMGMPKQERVAALLKKSSDVAAIIICGGAILDFQANRYSRAPFLFRKMGLEWLYRLYMEPKRMFYRYVIGIPKFFYHVIFTKA